MMDDDVIVAAVQLLDDGLFAFAKANDMLLGWRTKRPMDAGQIAAWEAHRVKAARMVREAVAALSDAKEGG